MTVEAAMPRATVTTRAGTVVSIEGTEDEIAAVVALFDHREDYSMPAVPVTRSTRSQARATPSGLVMELLSSGFFRQPRELGAVGAALAEQGHFYPVTTLSPLLLRLVRRKELRRMKEKGRWMYVG
jgi:hypothetical protein